MHTGQAHVFIGKNKSLGIKELAVTSVPHISLFGGAKTNNIRRVIMEIEKICQKYTLVAFEIGGFNIFQNSDANWLYLDVHQSVVLEQFPNLDNGLVSCWFQFAQKLQAIQANPGHFANHL